MWTHKPLASLLLIGSIAAWPGCSYVSATRIPYDHPISQDVDCSGWLPPTLDLGLGLAFGTGAGLFFSEVIDRGETWKLAGGVSGALLGAFFLATAITGYVWTTDCKACEELHVQWRMEDDDAKKRLIEQQWIKSRGLPAEGRENTDDE